MYVWAMGYERVDVVDLTSNRNLVLQWVIGATQLARRFVILPLYSVVGLGSRDVAV